MVERKSTSEFDGIVFDIDAVSGGSSGEAFSSRPERIVRAETDVAPETVEPASPIFKLLASPELPELKHEARARLMMQSPTRLYFYWSIGSQSFQALHKAIGEATADYSLAMRLLNLTTDVEELHTIGPEGNWWFKVEPENEYRAEIGFYSSSRPFVRILFSNTIVTPRKSPSPHSASGAKWAITTHAFAEVLEASGFEEDALEVVGSDAKFSLRSAFASHIEIDESKLSGIDMDELRRALSLLASGSPIEDLKWGFTAELYGMLQAHLNKLTAQSLESIGVTGTSDDLELEYETLSAVGGSLVNIPRRRYKPVSSMSLG